ncbi:hypothetical protein MY1884_001304 [Beauveria asiatica]
MMTTASAASAGPALIESPAFEVIRPRLSRTTSDQRPVVLMTCAIAGAGKSTLAKTVTARLPNFVRFSADQIVRDRHGLYGIDFARDRYAGYLDDAQAQIKTSLAALIRSGGGGTRDAVVDLSFYSKAYRDEYKEVVEGAGGRWVLVFLDAAADKELLWRRIQGRRAARDSIPVESGARDGDSAYDVERETFDMYWKGFERPMGEGEIRVPVSWANNT